MNSWAPSVAPAEEHVVAAFQAARHVVGVQQRRFGRAPHTFASEHRHIRPGDEQDRRAAPGRGGNRSDRLRASDFDQRMARQVRRELLVDADGPHARPAPTVGNRERLVQVHVADVRTVIAGAGQTHLGVQVGAVQIDQTAVFVHDAADVAHVLEDAVWTDA